MNFIRRLSRDFTDELGGAGGATAGGEENVENGQQPGGDDSMSFGSLTRSLSQKKNGLIDGLSSKADQLGQAIKTASSAAGSAASSAVQSPIGGAAGGAENTSPNRTRSPRSTTPETRPSPSPPPMARSAPPRPQGAPRSPLSKVPPPDGSTGSPRHDGSGGGGDFQPPPLKRQDSRGPPRPPPPRRSNSGGSLQRQHSAESPAPSPPPKPAKSGLNRQTTLPANPSSSAVAMATDEYGRRKPPSPPPSRPQQPKRSAVHNVEPADIVVKNDVAASADNFRANLDRMTESLDEIVRDTRSAPGTKNTSSYTDPDQGAGRGNPFSSDFSRNVGQAPVYPSHEIPPQTRAFSSGGPSSQWDAKPKPVPPRPDSASRPSRDLQSTDKNGIKLEPPQIEPTQPDYANDDSEGDSSATEGCDEVPDAADIDPDYRPPTEAGGGAGGVPGGELVSARRGSASSDQSWTSQDETMDAATKAIVDFMCGYVLKMFQVEETLSPVDKAKFGHLCQSPPGRLWFSRYVNAQALAVGLSLTFVHAQMRVSGGALQQITNGEEESAASAQEQVVGVSALSLALSVQRVNAKRVEEAVFFRLVQATAVALFECGESEDYSPAKTLMNMCFTFYYEDTSSKSKLIRASSSLFSKFTSTKQEEAEQDSKRFLYMYLKELPLWQSMRFWNAAFFEAIQTERARKPVPARMDGTQQVMDDREFQENITFGQLGTFTSNMRALGVSRDHCIQFMRKQATIANLSDEKIDMLRENIDQWRD